MRFLEGIGETRTTESLKRLRVVRAYDSTAIKGATLTLGDAVALVAEVRGVK